MKNLHLVHQKIMEIWRAGYNPLRRLTIARVVQLLEAGERGEYANLTWFFRFIEKRDATLRALKRRRISALAELDWNIKTTPENELPKNATKDMAERQAVTLRTAYDRVDNLNAAIKFLAVAEFRGFSHLEKHFDAAGDVIHMEPVEQWYWVRKRPFGPWKYDAKANSSLNNAKEITLENFVIREVEDPIDEIGAVSFMRKNLSQKDWDGFIEVFGIPALFLVGPPGVSAEKETEYQEIAEEILADMRGYLPNGATVETAGGDIRGTAPFREHIDYQDSQLVLAGTGGKLTMLNDPTGLGSGQSDAHQDTFDAIARAEAMEISEILQKQFDAAVLEKHHQGEPVLAYFQLAADDTEDTITLIDNAVKLSSAGLEMDADDLAERTGYKLTRTATPVFQPKPFGNRASGSGASGTAAKNDVDPLIASARKAAGIALANDMQPIRERLEYIMGLSEEAIPGALRNFRTELPRYLSELNADPAFAKQLENAMSAGLLNGYFQKIETEKRGQKT